MNKKMTIILSFLAVIAVVFLSNINKADCCNTYKKISFDEMDDKIKENDNYLIVDVRTLVEYNEGHIENSVLIPDYEIERINDIEPDKNKTIYVYCRSGNRSKTATNKILEMGYTNVYDVGGIIDYNGNIVK
jgi:rhodanese-related sulfurtransferase